MSEQKQEPQGEPGEEGAFIHGVTVKWGLKEQLASMERENVELRAVISKMAVELFKPGAEMLRAMGFTYQTPEVKREVAASEWKRTHA